MLRTPSNACWALALIGACSIAAPASLATQQDCVAAPQGLVAWWPLDGDANDIRGSNTGALVGADAFVAGVVGQALTFDGVEQYVLVTASQQIDVGSGPGLTIELWIDPAQVTDQQPLLEWNDAQGSIGASFWTSVAIQGGGNGSLFANLVDTSGTSHLISTGPNVISTAVFQHVALTYDQTTGLSRLYFNGQVAAEAQFDSFVPQTSYDLYMGFRPSGTATGNMYSGSMDEIGLYNRALDATEILGIFYAGSSGKCTASPPDLGILPSAALFTNSVEIVFPTTVVGGVIHYTLDGTSPTVSSPVYTAGVVITNATTVQARVFVDGLPATDVVTKAYRRVYVFDDEIPASWRLQYFGSDFLTDPRAAADADPDRDGSNNLQEFLAGTNPLDPLSGFTAATQSVPLVSWHSVSNSTYRILRRDAVAGGVWAPIVPSFRATNDVAFYVDLDALGSHYFYLIELLKP